MEKLDYLTDYYQKGVTKREKAWYLSKYAKIDVIRKMYGEVSVDPYSREAIKRVFSLLLKEKGAVLFHCTSGKDRTGIVAALILKVLGCTDEDIIRDYNASGVAFFSKSELFQNVLRKNGYSPMLYGGLQTTLSVTPEVIAAGLTYITENYPSEEDFIREATGFDQRTLETFRDKYLCVRPE